MVNGIVEGLKSNFSTFSIYHGKNNFECAKFVMMSFGHFSSQVVFVQFECKVYSWVIACFFFPFCLLMLILGEGNKFVNYEPEDNDSQTS